MIGDNKKNKSVTSASVREIFLKIFNIARSKNKKLPSYKNQLPKGNHGFIVFMNTGIKNVKDLESKSNLCVMINSGFDWEPRFLFWDDEIDPSKVINVFV